MTETKELSGEIQPQAVLIKGRSLTVACIPAYDEERTIAKVILKAKRHVDRVIVCDDGSTDMTAEIARSLGAELISHAKNSGYGASLAGLFRFAKKIGADVMVVLDGDGQHDPDFIPAMVGPISRGEADIVIGSRFLAEGAGNMPAYRKTGIKIINEMVNARNHEGITDAQSGFRAYGRRAIELLSPVETGMGASTEILIKAREHSLRVSEVPITVTYGENSSKENPVKHGVGVVLSTLKYMSIQRPLMFYGLPGGIALSIGLIFIVWSLQIFSETKALVTNITLIAVGATVIGFVLIATAVILWVVVSMVKENQQSRYGR